MTHLNKKKIKEFFFIQMFKITISLKFNIFFRTFHERNEICG